MAKRMPVHRAGLERDARDLRASLPSKWDKSAITALLGELRRETNARRELTRKPRSGRAQ